MIPKECKRLAEVDFPIAVVSRHSAREKSIRHGHPSTLHLWWARRPLAACRAMLMALLLPDPCDEQCPEEFKAAARRALLALPARPGRWDSEVRSDEGLRKVLLEFIGDFANWDNAANAGYLACGRGLVKAAHPDETPLVVDPFAGGGSIPLEALRLGCDAFASDLNPVACLILKVLLEDIPRHGPELAVELRRVGAQVKAAAESDLAELYPMDPGGARPIAYLWARTVRCEAPDCGAEIPVFRSGWLSKTPSSARFFKEDPAGNCTALVIEDAPKGGPIRFRIAHGMGSPEPRAGFAAVIGTKVPGNNANVRCPCCERVVSGSRQSPRVPAQLSSQQGGTDPRFSSGGERNGGAILLAVVTKSPVQQGPTFRLPHARDYCGVLAATRWLAAKADQTDAAGHSVLPNEPLPAPGTLGFRIQRYGMRSWRDLFTARQTVSLRYLATAASETREDTAAELLAAAVGRCADYWSSGALWAQAGQFVAHTFGRHAIPLVWDFAETAPWRDGSGGFDGAIDWIGRVIDAWPAGSAAAQVQQEDAQQSPQPDQSAAVWFTDPPYYDAVPYADLSDYFLIWLKRALPGHPLLRDRFDAANPLSPKHKEIVQDESKVVNGMPKNRSFFESAMAGAFAEGRRVLLECGIGCVVFAHKTTEGWEALLNGLIKGRWTIVASWPIATERPGRLRSQKSAALATSIHLVCRPRPDDALVGDWGDVLRELPRRVEAWMERLQDEGVRGADLVFACIGPALEIFSRYSKVETAEGREVPLDEYLLKVWEVVGRTALNQVLGTAEGRARNGAAGALEEDARLTALFLWTLQATTEESPTNGNGSGAANGDDEDADEPDEDEEEAGSSGRKKKGFSLIFDVARRFAQPLGIHLEAWEKRIIETEKGVVRLIPVLERAGQLFGEEGAASVADRLERSPATAAAAQMMLFPEPAAPPKVRGRGRRKKGGVADSEFETRQEATTLDRVHAAMLLQASGRANALRALLKAEVERGPDFLRLANALSALYPQGSDEKRLLDAMLLAVPR